MKISAIRRALLFANIFNLLVALYFIIIAIIALVQLRWYHQLTITVKVRYLLTSMTSYFAFLILIVAGLLLIAIFITGSLRIKPAKVYVGPNGEDAIGETNVISTTNDPSNEPKHQKRRHAVDTVGIGTNEGRPRQGLGGFRSHLANTRIVLRNSSDSNNGGESHDGNQTNTSVCCSILIHLITATCLIIILIIWLFNTGELVRDSISTQLEAAYNRYQFTNRSNYNTIAIDGMQDINNCCGSLDYTDFPHHMRTGLINGHYPGSCCGKNIFGVNARVVCTPEEIYRAKQTAGCTTVLSNYYDLISILVVPVALVSLFVNITIIALITILKGSSGYQHNLNDEANEGFDHLFYDQQTARGLDRGHTIRGYNTPSSRAINDNTKPMRDGPGPSANGDGGGGFDDKIEMKTMNA